MADSATLPESTDANSQLPNVSNPTLNSNPVPSDPPSNPSASSSSTPPPNPNTSTAPPPPPSLISPPFPAVPPSAPSFRPAAPPAPVPAAPQFSPLPNPNMQQTPTFQTSGVQPPGVSLMMPHAPGAPAVSGSGAPVVNPYAPVQPMRPYAPMPNGYPVIPQPLPQGTMPPPGIPRYPSPYVPMIRPVFPPRPPGAVGVVPPLTRPPIPVIRGPIVPPIVRPAIAPGISQAERPQITVYVGKISSTVENDIMLSILQLCGPVKSWKRSQDPTNGRLKGFGFCEFESAEGVLRALRLLSKLNIDGQELMLNVNQATREYLEHYVEKKMESSKKRKETEAETEGAEKVEVSERDAEQNEVSKPLTGSPNISTELPKKDDNDNKNKENFDSPNFGLVTDEDKETDREALEKLTEMIEKLKNRPLPPLTPEMAADVSGSSNAELTVRSKDGESEAETTRNAEDKNEDDMTSEGKPSSEHDKPDTSSPDRRKHDRKSRDRDRDLKREKERELERYEREREQERAKREKEREYRIREDERKYKKHEKEWESREREKEHWRKRDREREKERAQERKWEIMEQERESEDGYKKRKYKSNDEERKRRRREKEEDLADRLKEEEEIAEAKRRADEEQLKQQQKEAIKISYDHASNGHHESISPKEMNHKHKEKEVEQNSDYDSTHGEGTIQNGTGDESVTALTSDTRQSTNAPAKKLGFGLSGSGKRTAVPSVFNEDEDEDAQKEKKMRPLVPIDYSTEEQQAIQPSISEAPSSNLVAAAEFAKRISSSTPKEEKPDAEKERSRRSHDRSNQRDRDRHDEETIRTRDESRKAGVDRNKARDHGSEEARAPHNQKLLDAKQLIDMIPKTKDELFSYEINWAIFDKNSLHERMRPWISKKIMEFLGEEETTLVDYIVSSTQEHVKASEMLERLQAIFDEEAEMFVLKMWRMLIFEIKKVETGLALRPKA